MATIHHCTAFVYDVLRIIGTYLRMCMKVSDGFRVGPERKNPCISNGWYVGRPLHPSLQTFLITCNSKRAAATRHNQEPATVPAIGGLVGPGPGVRQVGGADGGGDPPGQLQGGGEIVTLYPTLTPFSASASCWRETLAGYSGTSHFSYWAVRHSSSSGTWGSPASKTALGRVHTLTLLQRWRKKLRRRWQRIESLWWGLTGVPDG